VVVTGMEVLRSIMPTWIDLDKPPEAAPPAADAALELDVTMKGWLEPQPIEEA